MPDHYADDIYGDINRKKQLEDAQENKEFDRDIEAYRRGQKNLTDEERLERMKDITAKRKQLKDNLLSAITTTSDVTANILTKSWQDSKKFRPWYDVGGNIGALGARAIEATIPTTPQELQAELVELKASGAGYPALKLAKEIPIVKKGLGKLDEATINLRRNLLASIRGDQILPDGTIVKKGTQPLMSKGSDAIDDGYIEEIVEQGDDVIFPPGSVEADIQANTKAMAKDDGYSYRKGRPLKNPIWDNLAPKVQKLFSDAGIDSDKAAFFIETWTEGPIPRELSATIEGLPFTDRTFEFMQSKLLPEILEDLKGINLSDGLELDHIAQLRAMLPFYQGRNLKQAEKIRRILIREGVFGGHNPKNLKYLPKDVHTVKTKFWENQVGKDGSKFFENRPMRTYADVQKAAKEMKEFISKSNAIVENLSVQYKVMRGNDISNDELWKLLQKVDLNKGEYNLKDVKKLIDEIDADYAAGNVPTLSKDEFTRTMEKMKRSVDWDELGLADKMRYIQEQTGMTYDQIDEFIKSVGLIRKIYE